MRSFHARGVTAAILLASLSSVALSQDGDAPSLFPQPPRINPAARMPAAPPQYPVQQTADSGDQLWYQGVPSPAPAPAPSPSDRPLISPDYADAMQGGYDGGSVCNRGNCCAHNHYVYANALVMTRDQRGGLVTTIDSTTLASQANFGNPWHGGIEVGTGWCFGSNGNQAIEAVYWGLYPATQTVTATGSLNSTLNFSDLDYNGASANAAFTGSTAQQVQYGFNINSVEVNLVGNGCCGGPFGCGMCGGCNGRGGSPWGFGYVAGFRYINFNENWLFSGDTTDQQINGDPTELNYRVQLNNNLFGFQLGSGLSYCLTNRLSAYTIAKFGVYDNYMTQSQRIFGTAGNATVNIGPNAGQDFNITASDSRVAFVGQIDFGGRWAVTDNWSVNFGYRLVGLTGVAIAQTNVQQTNFQNLQGIADPQATGSFILHGAFVGATYCW